MAAEKAPPLSAIIKTDSASDLIKALGLDFKMHTAITNSDGIFKNMAKAKATNTDKKFAISLQKTEERFNKEKDKIAKDMSVELHTELLKRFSAAELKYLSDLSKYPVIKRFGDFLTSQEYNDILAKPVSEIAKIRREVKIELGMDNKSATFPNK
jgi:hypothetical protein